MRLAGAAGLRMRSALPRRGFLRLPEEKEQMAALPYFDERIWRIAEHFGCPLTGHFSRHCIQIDRRLYRTVRSEKCELIAFQNLQPPAGTGSVSIDRNVTSTDGLAGG